MWRECVDRACQRVCQDDILIGSVRGFVELDVWRGCVDRVLRGRVSVLRGRMSVLRGRVKEY